MIYTGRTLRDEDVRQSIGDTTIIPITPIIQNNAIASPIIVIYFLVLISFCHYIIQFNNKLYPLHNKLNAVSHFYTMQQQMQSYSRITTSNNEPTTKHFQDHGG